MDLPTAGDSVTRKRPPEHEVQAGPSRLPYDPTGPDTTKRVRLTPDTSDAGKDSTHTARADLSAVSDAALLYHVALSAHAASAQHLQQAFVPSWVVWGADPSVDTVPLYHAPAPALCDRNTPAQLHDACAEQKAFRLQFLSLDLLGIGLRRSDLSDAERAAFAIEFVTVGIKIRQAISIMDKKGKGRAIMGEVDLERLADDMQVALSAANSACERNYSLGFARQRLVWLSVKVALLEGRVHLAKRMVRQSLNKTAQSNIAHRFGLYFLLLDQASKVDYAEAHGLMEEMQAEARDFGHRQILQILAVARVRLCSAYRRWDAVQSALDQLSDLLNWSEDSLTSTRLSSESAEWHTSLTAHYLLLRSLWEGRIGHDAKCRGLLKRLYLLMDEAADSGLLDRLRQNGGLIEIEGLDQPMSLQTTPINALYRLTFLATVTSRRDFMGPDATCKNLIHIRAMREFELVARRDDLWDTGFGTPHSLADAWEAQDGVVLATAEIMLEDATASLLRSNFERAAKVLDDFAILARAHVHLSDTLGPHLCFVHAMLAQLLGNSDAAIRYYRAALALLQEGSELALSIESSLLGVQGLLEGVKEDHKRQQVVVDLAGRCKRTSSVAINAVGQLLAALADENLMMAKKKIGAAYDLCQQSNNNLLRALIFAFTSSTHLTGSEERVQKQLETGLDIATLLGGRDRPDEVGQPVLGLWFAVRLKSLHHRRQDQLAFGIARSRIQRFVARLDEVIDMGKRRYAQVSSLADLRDM